MLCWATRAGGLDIGKRYVPVGCQNIAMLKSVNSNSAGCCAFDWVGRHLCPSTASDDFIQLVLDCTNHALLPCLWKFVVVGRWHWRNEVLLPNLPIPARREPHLLHLCEDEEETGWRCSRWSGCMGQCGQNGSPLPAVLPRHSFLHANTD